MKKNAAFLLWTTLSCPVLFTSCQKSLSTTESTRDLTAMPSKANNGVDENTFKGPEVSVGNGKARTWITIGHEGTPQEIGIELKPEALTGLPTVDSHEPIILRFHQKVFDLTPFDHVSMNWNPFGHPPPGVFDKPHFDFHFYMTGLADQLAIPPYSPASVPFFNKVPPPGYMPANYILPPNGATAVPMMGNHWLPANFMTMLPFTQIMILGTYNGHFTFIEPMVTLKYLQSGTTLHQPYGQPLHFEHTGKYYPTRYNIFVDEKTGSHQITLSDFVLR